MSRSYPGLYRGVVVDNDDPEELLRVKVKVVQLLGPDAVLPWAWPSIFPVCDAVAPAVGDPIWIMFEAGDIEHPVWMGSWASEDPPPRPLVSGPFERSTYTGTDVGRGAFDSAGHVVVTYKSEWGITSTGDAYFNDLGVASGDEAVFSFVAGFPTLTRIVP